MEQTKKKPEPQYYSISQISAYRGCKRGWAYRYVERLESRAPQRPLYIGSTLHKLLEIRANGGNWSEYLETTVRKKFEAMPETYRLNLGEDFVEVVDKIMRQYDWAYANEKIKYLATEVKIDTKIKGRKRFVGVVDAICEIDGDQYIMEHKTFKTQKMSTDQTWLNQQTCLYIRVLNQQGWNIKGVIWDMIKTTAYKPPKRLKSGAFGKQYSDQTQLSFYDDGILKEDIPDEVYEEIKDNHLNFLDRYVTPVSPSVVEAVWQDFVETVEEISKNKSTARNLGRDCERCPFKDLCQTGLTGGDVEYIKQLYYTDPIQREVALFKEFAQTTECLQCQAIIHQNGVVTDFDQCILFCEKYRKFKEEKKNNE